MLFVGVDWAEAQHAVCLVKPDGTVVRLLTIPHSAAGVARLREGIAAVEAEPAAVLVAVERPDGLLVEALLDAGYVVYALNPKAVDRYRERTRVAGGKTDPAVASEQPRGRGDPGAGPARRTRQPRPAPPAQPPPA